MIPTFTTQLLQGSDVITRKQLKHNYTGDVTSRHAPWQWDCLCRWYAKFFQYSWTVLFKLATFYSFIRP